MGQKFSMGSLSPQEQARLFSGGSAGHGGAGGRYAVDPSRARPIVRGAAERAEGFDDPIRAAKRGVDAPGEVEPLVEGAFAAFLEARGESIDAIRRRALAVTEAAGQALDAYDAGDEEMAQSTFVAAAKAGAAPFDRSGR